MEVVLCINHLFLAITRQKLLLLERAGEAIVVVALPSNATANVPTPLVPVCVTEVSTTVAASASLGMVTVHVMYPGITALDVNNVDSTKTV